MLVQNMHHLEWLHIKILCTINLSTSNFMFVIVELFAKAVLDDPEEPNIVVNSIEEYEDESPYIFFIKETSFMNIFQV